MAAPAPDVPALSVHTREGIREDGSVVLDVVRSQRHRFLDVLRALPDSDWPEPSRCADWTVHQVARHVCDASRLGAGLLDGALFTNPDEVRFDARTSPGEWLKESEGQSPAQTLTAFEADAGSLVDAVERRLRAGDDNLVAGPYGPVHWTVLALHVFWDGWIHERDVLLALGGRQESPQRESQCAALYGILIAGIPRVMMSQPLDEVVELHGDGGGTFHLEADDASRATTPADTVVERPLTGALDEVVDSLMGRGPELADVLKGPPERVAALSALRTFMLTPAG